MNIGPSVLCLCILLAACDRFSGVRTDAELKMAIDYECVDRAIRSVQGAGDVLSRVDQSENIQIAPYRGKVVTTSRAWLYGPQQMAVVQVTDDGLKIKYTNGMMKMGEPWPSSRLVAFMPSMKQVNEAVEKNCGVPISAVSRQIQY